MKTMNLIPQEIVREADILSKEIHLPFRTVLEILYKAYLEAQQEVQPEYQVPLCRILART
jgi:hypothetical protein